jgi:hypothetical protein
MMVFTYLPKGTGVLALNFRGAVEDSLGLPLKKPALDRSPSKHDPWFRRPNQERFYDSGIHDNRHQMPPIVRKPHFFNKFNTPTVQEKAYGQGSKYNKPSDQFNYRWDEEQANDRYRRETGHSGPYDQFDYRWEEEHANNHLYGSPSRRLNRWHWNDHPREWNHFRDY